ncbi:uncharacterized protein PADG_03614 [Paracoccidioides brasiliensis Pb18]|uniref:Uncharacterized protein n=1 Tax=Paracoccidioides brasiliensis (strain Pb18) TaxID=502780 RepID=C1G8M8_PARBD|nr:uncharacterized protein PADG_03614 [Paracoccidioides brasiliensis Pb18]EEH47530.2 hypothetical protein PADG_03614 [Paracoccidioides brasiliensis Pb18]
MAVIAVLFYAPLYLSATMTGLRLIPQAVKGAAGSLGLGYPDARGRSLWSRFGDREGAIEIIQKIRNSLDYINKGASGLGILEY